MRSSEKKEDSGDNPSVKVAIRIRPLLPSESGFGNCVKVLTPSFLAREGGSDGVGANLEIGSGRRSTSLCLTPPNGSLTRSPPSSFTFDQVLPPSSTQREVYDACVKSLVEKCLSGYNATVIAYGQTGSGKTYTMLGRTDVEGEGGGDEGGCQEGIILRAMKNLFQELDRAKSAGDRVEEDGSEVIFNYEVRVQCLELYGEDLRDLLVSPSEMASSGGAFGGEVPYRPPHLQIRDVIRKGANDSTVESLVIGATEVKVEKAEDALLCLSQGIKRRVTGVTAMNAESSRSHVIMTVMVEQTTTTVHHHKKESISLVEEEGGMVRTKEMEVKQSKFHFVDLAGCERQKRTMASNKR